MIPLIGRGAGLEISAVLLKIFFDGIMKTQMLPYFR
jgi:hypothetical protein